MDCVHHYWDRNITRQWRVLKKREPKRDSSEAGFERCLLYCGLTWRLGQQAVRRRIVNVER